MQLLHDHQLAELLPQVRGHHPAGRDPARPAPPARQLHLLRVQGQHRQRRGGILCNGAGRLLPGSLLQPRRQPARRPRPTGSRSTATISSRTTGPSALTGSSPRKGTRPSSRAANNLSASDPDDPLFGELGIDRGEVLSYCSTPDGAFLGTTDIFLSHAGRVRDQDHLAARSPGIEDLEPEEGRSHRRGYGLQRLRPRARSDLQLGGVHRRPGSANRCRIVCRAATRWASGSSSRAKNYLQHGPRFGAGRFLLGVRS